MMARTTDPTATAEPTTRRPGRPRSAQAERAILAATLELFAKLGYEGMSIEGIAARAGVGKTTIYRRWSSKDELLGDALGQVQAEVPVTDSGELRDDLIAMATNALRFFAQSGGIFVRAIGEIGTNPAVFAAFSEKVMAPRFAHFGARIERAIAEGELRADIEPQLLIDLLAGPIFFRSLVSGHFFPVPPDHAERLIDALLQGLAPR